MRRCTPIAVVALLVLAACGTDDVPRIEDPREILDRSMEVMGEVESLYLELSLDGSLPTGDALPAITLDGTEISGSVAMDGSAAELVFAVPAFLDLEGEVRIHDGTPFLRSSMTGPLWVRSDGLEVLGIGMADAVDLDGMLADLRALLGEEGVALTKLGEIGCGDGTCYELELTAQGGVLVDGPGSGILDPVGEAEVTINLRIDVATLHLVEVSTSLGDPGAAALDVSLNLDGFDDPVEVEAPPSDEVIDDPSGFPIPIP